MLAEVTGLFAGGEMADEDMREMVDAIQEAYLIAKKNNKNTLRRNIEKTNNLRSELSPYFGTSISLLFIIG